MKIVDLGELSGQLLVFGGVYSNLQALQALVEEATKRNIPATNMICTGDIVAYCADAEACVELIKNTECPVLAGNCEQQLAESAKDCGCGFEAGTMCEHLSASWFKHADESVSKASRSWMATLPERILFSHSGKKYTVIHGGADEVAKFIWPSDDDSIFAAEIENLSTDVVLAGHSGIAFERNIAEKSWINAGAIGIPPHDGGGETRFVIIDKDHAEIHKLVYDNYWAAMQMQAVGLNNGYNTSLISGYWPSEENLPEALRR